MSDEQQGGNQGQPPGGGAKRRRRRRRPRKRQGAEGAPTGAASETPTSAAKPAQGGEGPPKRRRRRRRKPRDGGGGGGDGTREAQAAKRADGEGEAGGERQRRRRRRPNRRRRASREATAVEQAGAAGASAEQAPGDSAQDQDPLGSVPADDGWDFIEEGGEALAELTGEVTAVAPADRAADKAPANRAPADRAPADRAPADRAPADRAPADRAPADRAPAPRSGRRGKRRSERAPRQEPTAEVEAVEPEIDRSQLPSVLDPTLAEPSDDDIFLALEEAEAAEGHRPPRGKLRNMVAVRLGLRGDRVQEFDAGELALAPDDPVVVETERGLAVGTVVQAPMRRQVGGDVSRLLRRIDANDERQVRRNAGRQREAYEFCHERIQQRGLPMKLIRVEYLHSGNKALFFFSAEHRIDFRELVRDLARHLRVRVEMRQVGVRDAAAMTGGIGSCGQNLCCGRFLQRFDPVSIRMAKDQNLVLNPTKVSGQCGRLKCCLGYEQKLYQKARRKLPKVGGRVTTPDGPGRVRELDILRQLVRVQHQDGSIETYAASDVSPQPHDRGPRPGPR